MSEYADRRARLLDSLRELESIAVAYSGGVDSAALLHAAHSVLGDKACGVIADSPSLPRRELREALELARTIGARVEVIATHELDDERYRANAGDRCYFCKSALFSAMEPWARAQGFRALAFGEITDDLSDIRPVAPLSAAGFSKEDVRRYAREAGLVVAEKPSSACLASRLPVGTRVSAERLGRIERAEEALKQLGLRQLRVRDLGESARVEVGRDELAFARERMGEIGLRLAAEGFARHELAAYLSVAERALR